MADGLSLYERDFVRWSEEQAHALRTAAETRINLPLDWDNLAEEIDGLGRSLRSELRNRLATVLEHLFKLSFSEAADPHAGWIETIMRERIEIAALLDDNPSLRPGLSDSLAGADQKARKLAEISLRRHGEWTLQVGRAIGDTRFTEAQVLGGWLPKVEGQGSP